MMKTMMITHRWLTSGRALMLGALLSLGMHGAALAEHSVTAAMSATYDEGTQLDGLAVATILLSSGVVLDEQSPVAGHMFITLRGPETALALQDTDIEVEVNGGSVDADGLANLWGTASVSRNEGLDTQHNVPFLAVLSADSVQLTLGNTQLPVARLSEGSISIE